MNRNLKRFHPFDLRLLKFWKEKLPRTSFIPAFLDSCTSPPELLTTLEVRCTGVFSSFVDLSHASWRIRPALREHSTSPPACGDPLWSIPTPDTPATLLPGPTPPCPHFILLHGAYICIYIIMYRLGSSRCQFQVSSKICVCCLMKSFFLADTDRRSCALLDLSLRQV